MLKIGETRMFRVYHHADRGFEAVKAGFCWPALCFGLLWMLLSRLWMLFFLFFMLYTAFNLAEHFADTLSNPYQQLLIYVTLIPLYLLLWLIPGFEGNEWRQKNLTRRNYRLVDTVRADSKADAIYAVRRTAFQERMAPTQAEPAEPG